MAKTTTAKKSTTAKKTTATKSAAKKTSAGEKFDVILKTKGALGLKLIKDVRDIMKVPLDDAKDVVDNVPAVIVSGVSKSVATRVSAVLKTSGSKVAVVTSKKTTTAKPAAKKVAAPKATEISVTGNKKIDTLRKEFNKKFPYLRLSIYYSYARQQVAKGESITSIDGSKTIASVRRADSGGDISISGNKKIKSLEKEFDKVFGLYCQICYTEGDGSRYYTSGSNDDKTLAAFNAECEKDGCKKGCWK